MAQPGPRSDAPHVTARPAWTATATAVGWALLLSLACGTRDDPSTCVASVECGAGYSCNMARHKCERMPGGPGSSPEGGPRIDGTGGMPAGDGGANPPGNGNGNGSGSGDGDAAVDPGDPGIPVPGPDAPPDTPPDAPGTCSENSHCAGSTSQCFENTCVACTVDMHCPSEKRRCTEARTCVECLAAVDCPTARPFCTTDNVCVECQGHGDCKSADQPLCAAGACVACDEGGGNAACAQKTSNALPICLPGGSCVQCGVSTDCKADSSPICEDNECVGCTRDAECKERDGDKPGICLFPRDGRCARDDETIYVQNATPCSMNGGEGRFAMPFCEPQAALGAVAANRRMIRLRGPQPLSELEIEASGAQITIVGQEGATITSPSEIGVQIGSGNLHIRGLKVTGNQTGIVVDGGSTVQLNRVIVELNREGGLRIANGATFDITNSVFAKNGLGSVGPTRFGGVFLGTPGGGRNGRFRANTVVDNNEAGVVCNSTNQSLIGVLLFNNLGLNSFNCMEPSGREGVDPRFSTTRAYHLTEGAPCQDAMSSSDMPADDIDGEARPPNGTRSDCGADEYLAP